MIFTGMSERSSGQIRGIQISDQIRSSGKDAKFIDTRDSSILSTRDQTVIFIRSLDRSIASRLKNQGCRIVFDVLDRPVADIHESQKMKRDFFWESYSIPEIDSFIVNNSALKDKIEYATKKTCTIIPHHAVGSDYRSRSLVVSAGYIGLPDQLDCKDEIENVLRKFGVKFFSKNPTNRDDCIKDLRDLDLGIIFLKKNARTDPVLKYKPNTKLTNFQSFGIPTISIPYHSFVEFGGDCWIQTSESSILEDIEKFLDHPEKIEKISFDSIENSKKYTIERVSQMYEIFA